MIEKEIEKPVLHLMVNNTCSNNCPLCCNKQYDVDEIPVVTVEELKSVDTVCLTGGQPIHNIDACIRLCKEIENSYKNITQIFIYINGAEFLYDFNESEDLETFWELANVKNLKIGLTMSPKSDKDWESLNLFSEDIRLFKPNRIYCFSNKDEKKAKEIFPFGDVDIVRRVWQKDFVPAPSTIFRRLPIWLL